MAVNGLSLFIFVGGASVGLVVLVELFSSYFNLLLVVYIVI